MEIASIKPHPDFYFSLNTPPYHSKSFLVSAAPVNGIKNHVAQFTVSDVEMIAIDAAANYTSLKDLLPNSPSTVMSPTNSRRDSWREIQIKDPLVQHAAWAYLQPMAPDHEEADSRSLLQKLKEQCCGVFGCFNDVVLVMIKTWFSAGREDVQHQEKEGEEDKFD